jgi:hypothetical protein
MSEGNAALTAPTASSAEHQLDRVANRTVLRQRHCCGQSDGEVDDQRMQEK